MKKLILLFFIFCFSKTFAQSGGEKAVSLGAELGIPGYGAFTVGTGASAKLEFPVISPVSLSLTGGMTAMFYKGNFFGEAHSAAIFIPLKAGLKYYVNHGIYLEGEAGTAIEANYSKQSVFAWSVGPGFIVPINDKHGLDIGFRYESWTNQLHQTAVRFAYHIGW